MCCRQPYKITSGGGRKNNHFFHENFFFLLTTTATRSCFIDKSVFLIRTGSIKQKSLILLSIHSRSILPNMPAINPTSVKCAPNSSITKPIWGDICAYTPAKNPSPVMSVAKASSVKIEWLSILILTRKSNPY